MNVFVNNEPNIVQLKLLTLIDDTKHQSKIYELLKNLAIENITSAKNIEEAKLYITQASYDIILLHTESLHDECMNFIKSFKKDSVIILSNNSDKDFLLKIINIRLVGFINLQTQLSEIKHEMQRLIALKISEVNNEKKLKSLEGQLLLNDEVLRQKKIEIRYQRFRDHVTGLFNRVKLHDLLKRREPKILLYINIDNFSHINLGYGFQIGDELLKLVGGYFERMVNYDGSVFRMQSDEFVILLQHDDMKVAEGLAEKISTNLPKMSFQIENVGIKLSCTIGISAGKNKTVLNKANTAYLEARLKGKNRVGCYNQSSRISANQKKNLKWINLLMQAIETNSLIPYYQPIIDNLDLHTSKYECLIRLKHDDKIYTPSFFLESAKIAGMLPIITGIIIEKTLPLLVNNNIAISINITDQDFKGLFIVDYLKRKTTELNIDPSRITLEIVEDLDIGLIEEKKAQVDFLKIAGFKIALDDFGVAGSNFSRISQYRPDYIKIDGSFIKDVDKNPENANIVQLLSQFAQSIGAKSIAEHVHNQATFEKTKELGINFSQGFYFGKPNANFNTN